MEGQRKDATIELRDEEEEDLNFSLDQALNTLIVFRRLNDHKLYVIIYGRCQRNFAFLCRRPMEYVSTFFQLQHLQRGDYIELSYSG
jgi:hypothetical protein